MTWQVPEVIEAALWDAARARLPEAVVGGPRLTAAVLERSKRYTSERDRLAVPAGDADLAARALFFTVADAAKAMVALAELGPRLDWATEAAPLRVLDIGAGAGAMSLGVIAHAARIGARRGLAIEAVDRDAGALAIMADAVPRAASALGVRATVSTRRGEVGGAARGGAAVADLVLIGSVVNELDEPAALALVRAAISVVTEDGAVVIVEPALRECARALHRLRDAVIAAGWAHVFAPCTRRAAPCPMLADERDWCHEERPAGLPPRAARIAQVTGLRDGGLKFSYLTLRKQAGTVGGEVAGALRVVSHPHSSKGKLELFACGDDGRSRLRLLSRHRAESNRAFERARRGDVLRIDGAVERDVVRETEVELVVAANPDDDD